MDWDKKYLLQEWLPFLYGAYWFRGDSGAFCGIYLCTGCFKKWAIACAVSKPGTLLCQNSSLSAHFSVTVQLGLIMTIILKKCVSDRCLTFKLLSIVSPINSRMNWSLWSALQKFLIVFQKPSVIWEPVLCRWAKSLKFSWNDARLQFCRSDFVFHRKSKSSLSFFASEKAPLGGHKWH